MFLGFRACEFCAGGYHTVCAVPAGLSQRITLPGSIPEPTSTCSPPASDAAINALGRFGVDGQRPHTIGPEPVDRHAPPRGAAVVAAEDAAAHGIAHGLTTSCALGVFRDVSAL